MQHSYSSCCFLGGQEQKIDLTGICSDELEAVICDGTNTSVYAPVYGFNYDCQNARVQMIYPAEMLADLEGADIIGVTFHPMVSVGFYNGSLQLNLGGTEATEFSKADGVINGAGFFDLTGWLGSPITLNDSPAPTVQNFRLPDAGTYNIKLVADRDALEGLKMVVTKETVTAIETVKGEVKGDNDYYNLMGQKMNGNNLPAGIYIHNGKKVIVR